MANDIDDSFVTLYDSEIKLAYQRMGPQLRGTTRTSNEVVGNTVVFQKMGKGAANTKGRNSDVTPMNPTHATASATIADYYAPEYIDKLDLLKVRHDERRAVQETSVAAIGRQDDSLLITVLEAATTNQSTARNLSALGSTATAAVVAGIFSDHISQLGRRDVPLQDGNLFSAVSMQVWDHMLTIDQFARAEYVGATPLAAMPWTARRWMGCEWRTHTGLTLNGTSRFILTWHKNSIGKGVGMEIGVEISYVPQKVAFLINSMTSVGYVNIDTDGVQQILVNEGS